jgi:hypothetical protein
MARAAGGTSQRLKPAFAIVLSRLRIPPLAAAVPSMLPVVFIVISPDTYGFHVNKPLQHAKLFRKNDTQKTFHRPRCASREPPAEPADFAVPHRSPCS